MSSSATSLVIGLGSGGYIAAFVTWLTLSNIQRRRFHWLFTEVFDFEPPMHKSKRPAMEKRTMAKLEEAAREIAKARKNLLHYAEIKNRDTIESLAFKTMLFDQTAKGLKNLEYRYKQMRRLARHAGYSRKQLNELDWRILLNTKIPREIAAMLAV